MSEEWLTSDPTSRARRAVSLPARRRLEQQPHELFVGEGVVDEHLLAERVVRRPEHRPRAAAQPAGGEGDRAPAEDEVEGALAGGDDHARQPGMVGAQHLDVDDLHRHARLAEGAEGGLGPALPGEVGADQLGEIRRAGVGARAGHAHGSRRSKR